MITISLDEQGIFENNDTSNGDIVFIAGIIYDDHGDEKETLREKSRIKNYFSLVCKKANASYPENLHFGNGDNTKVGVVKREYSGTLADFLKTSEYGGKKILSDDGKERCGEYSVYMLLKTKEGKPELLTEDVSNLINESNASNLYMHMVEDVISRILFYNNTFRKKDEVTLDLATRIYKGKKGEDVSDHLNIGFQKKDVRDGSIVYLTDSGVFRTALAREMIYDSESSINIRSLKARSIDYSKPDGGYEFLYLADAVCTVIGFKSVYGSSDSYINKSRERLEKLIGKNYLLYLYDSIDTGFVKAWKCANSGDTYGAIATFYDNASGKGAARQHYKDVWEPELINLIKEKLSVMDFSVAVRKYSASTRRNDFDQQKLVYIFMKLDELGSSVRFTDSQEESVLYELYDAGATAYNHIGKPEIAKKYINKSKEYAKYINIEKELRSRNKLVVSLCDSFRFQDALGIALQSYEAAKKISDVRGVLFPDQNTSSNSTGVVISQLGQVYAFMNDPKAESYFLEALSQYDRGTSDYYQTESYLLHYYVLMRDKERYDQYSKEMFGDQDEPMKQLEYIVMEGSKEENPKIFLKFALFIYLKGLYTFHIDDIDDENLGKILNIRNTINSIRQVSESQFNGHPWPLIYKYLALFAHDRGRERELAKYVSAIKQFPSVDSILAILCKCSILNITDDQNSRNMQIKETESLMISIYPELQTCLNGTLENINKLVSFMFS